MVAERSSHTIAGSRGRLPTRQRGAQLRSRRTRVRCAAVSPAMLTTALPFPVRRGKVRDVYDLGEQLLIIATDRISAFDCVMPNGIPDKGKILTALSLFWFAKFEREFENHLIAT